MLPYYCCCYSYNNTSNSITEKLSNLAREVNSSESLAWRANQLYRNLGQTSYTHCSPFPHRCWYGFWRQSKGAEIINSGLSECIQLCYLASHVAEPPMREKNTEYAGSGFLPFQKYIVLKSCQVDAMTLLIFPLKEIARYRYTAGTKQKKDQKNPHQWLTICLCLLLRTQN